MNLTGSALRREENQNKKKSNLIFNPVMDIWILHQIIMYSNTVKLVAGLKYPYPTPWHPPLKWTYENLRSYPVKENPIGSAVRSCYFIIRIPV